VGGAFAGAFVFALVLGGGLAEAFGYGVIEAVSSGVGAWVGQSIAGRPPNLGSPRDVAALVAAVVVGSLLGGVAAAAWSAADESAPFAEVLHVWASSCIAGGLLVAPLVIAWHGFRARRSGGLAMPAFLAGAVMAVLFLGGVWLHFASLGESGLADELTYLPLLFLVVVALLWGARGATLVAFAAALIAVAYTVAGRGPFVGAEGVLGEDVLEVQAYAATMALAALVVAALAAGQRRAMLEARDWRTRFEAAIGAHGIVAYEWDPASGRLVLTGDTDRMLGRAAQRYATLADWLSAVESRDRDEVQRRFDARASGPVEVDAISYALTTAAGPAVAVIDEARAIRDHDGTLHRVVGIVRPAAQAGA
jgi:integral membrane sensor domain MASE1